MRAAHAGTKPVRSLVIAVSAIVAIAPETRE